MHAIERALTRSGFLMNPGFYAVVDGQYGSTGKGLLSSVLAEHAKGKVDIVTSNAGPNSGHTSYHGERKVVLRQLPTFSVMHQLFHGHMPVTHLNAGAIIEWETLGNEVVEYIVDRHLFSVSDLAAVVGALDTDAESPMVSRIGSTGKGTGAALASKIMRELRAVFGGAFAGDHPFSPFVDEFITDTLEFKDVIDPSRQTILAEVSQGFSLSLNAGGFYPFCTSRDCTVGQAMSDAGVHPSFYRDCAMVVRTFPIRVAGNSGGCYPDQRELTWDEVGQIPELTTVTQKTRRIFSWSKQQFKDAVRANRPGVVMVNFMNYLHEGVDHEEWLMNNVYRPYYDAMGTNPKMVLLGYGPNNSDVRVHEVGQ